MDDRLVIENLAKVVIERPVVQDIELDIDADTLTDTLLEIVDPDAAAQNEISHEDLIGRRSGCTGRSAQPQCFNEQPFAGHRA